MSDAIYSRIAASALVAILCGMVLFASAGPAAADFRLCNNTGEPRGRRRRLQGRRRLDHGRLVEFAVAHLRDRAQGQSRRPLLLCLRHRLRSRRRMDGTGLYVHPRQGIHHPRRRRLSGARLRPHRLFRSGYRRAGGLDRAAHRIERAVAAAPVAGRQPAHPAPAGRRCAAPGAAAPSTGARTAPAATTPLNPSGSQSR